MYDLKEMDNKVMGKLDFVDLINEIINSDNALSYIVKLKENDVVINSPSNEVLDRHIDDLIGFLAEGNVDSALVIVHSLFAWKKNKAISIMKRKGVFRSSKYKFNSKSFVYILGYCIDNVNVFDLSENDSDFLYYLKCFSVITKEVEGYRDYILIEMRKNKDKYPKTLMAIIEYIFGYYNGGNGFLSHLLLDNNKECCAESISYLLLLFEEEIGLGKENLFYIEDDINSYEKYSEVILIGCKIVKYIEAEILINSFGYSATLCGQSKVIIKSTDPYLEKTIRLGYIKTDLQAISRGLDVHSNCELIDFETVVSKIFHENRSSFFSFKDDFFERYVLEISSHSKFLNFFSTDYIFKEDVFSLAMLDMEHFSNNELENMRVFNDITVFDMLIFQRFLRFINYIYAEAFKLDAKVDCKEILMLNTILPVMNRDMLKSLLGIVMPEKKIEDCLSIICTQLSDTDYFDIQYTPIVSIEEWNFITPSIISRSNLIRNILCNKSLRPTLIGGQDPMQNELIARLESKGFQVELECFLYGSSLETDILAFKDGYIFLFECKNSYHPCNVHEMRTSFEHLKKGLDQVEIRRKWLENENNQKELYSRLGWEGQYSQVISCIVTSNRIFHGYESDNIYVRHAHEIINILNNGVVKLGSSTHRVWKKNEFETLDLVEYIKGSTLVSCLFSALHEVDKKYLYNNKTLEFSTYELDVISLFNMTKLMFEKID